MFLHFVKYAIRYFWRNRLFSLINIGGLTIGLSCFILIINFVQQELSYDKFHMNSESLYRVNMIRKASSTKATAIGPPMGAAMQAEFPEVESFVRLRHADNVLIGINDDEFYENQVFYADSSFFNIFNFPLSYGNPHTALSKKNTAVISQELANKYFKGQDPIGKTILVDDNQELTITGVVGKTNGPSHFKFQLLISFTSFEVPMGYPVSLDSWGWTSFPTYIRLKENTDPDEVNAKFDEFIKQHMGEVGAEKIALELQSLTDVYLYSKEINERNGIPTRGDINYVIILIAIATLILVIAAFNFTNLTISLSLKRVKEIGVRKTLGAQRKVVFLQYCTEAISLVFISFVLAAACLEIFNSSLSTLFNAPFNLLNNLQANWVYYLLIMVVIGLAGGLYPAVYLSKFSPVKALKNNVALGKNSLSMKTVLIGAQFSISILLVLASVVINDQMKYLQGKDLGYEKDRVVALQMNGEALAEKYMLTRQQLLQKSYVKSVTASGHLFDGQNGSVPIQERNDDQNSHRISLFSGHYDFTKALGIEVLEGRDFSENFANDSTAFILNESAVKMFGWKDSAIGKNLLLNGVWEGEVIGVVKDFNFASLHAEITPLILYISRTYNDYIYVKFNKGNLSEIMTSLNADWNEMHPELPFNYTFLDSHVDNMYKSDQEFSSLVYAFSSLAIFLACIGLYGMVAYSIDTKQKEIGIRKVLGASVSQVVILLSKQFVVLILIASLIAFPVSWILLQDWLSEFAYRIEISALHLAIAFVGTALIVGITLSTRTIRAAQSNPVDTLKEE